jgi:dihydroflavonol-4-reductase
LKILVTGANGFIGSWLVKKLITDGHSVRVLARATSDLSELAGLDFEKSVGDVTDFNSLVSALKGIETVFNLAGLIAYKKIDRPKMELVNVQGTANLLSAMSQQSVTKLVHMSSVVAIGSLFKPDSPLDEASKYNLTDFDFGYFETKRKSEVLVKEWHDLNRGEAIIFNPSTVYGPGDAKKSSRKTQVKVANGTFKFYSPGGVSIAHVEDVVNVLASCTSKKLNGERYILAGQNITIKELFDCIAEAAGVTAPKYALPGFLLKSIAGLSAKLDSIGLSGYLPDGETILVSQMYHWYDSTKAKKAFNYNTRPAKACIGDSVQWMKQNHYLAKNH